MTCLGCGREIKMLTERWVALSPFDRDAVAHPRCFRDGWRKLAPASATVTGIEVDGPL